MGVITHLSPKEIWGFFQKNRKRMRDELVVVAENNDTAYAIYVTENDGQNEGNPLFLVHKENCKVFERDVFGEDECADIAMYLYVRFLVPVTVTSGKAEVMDEGVWDDPSQSKQDMEDLIYEREDELSLAMTEFLEVLLNCTTNEIDAMYGCDFLQQTLDDFCEYLAKEHCISVYRPTFLPTIDGEDFVEYPYSVNENVDIGEDD